MGEAHQEPGCAFAHSVSAWALKRRFPQALTALLGKKARNPSPSVITRLAGERQTEHESWQARDISGPRYVYVSVDGVYLQAGMEDQALKTIDVLCRPSMICRRSIGFTCEARMRSTRVFATVRHRTVRTKGTLSSKTSRLIIIPVK